MIMIRQDKDNMIRVLHIMASGGTGGIEVLCKDFTKNSRHENYIMFLWGEGILAEEIKANGIRTTCMRANSKNIINVVKSVVKYCKENNIQIVIAHHAAPLAHLCLFFAKLFIPKIKTIAYAHGNATIMYRENERKGLWIRKLILRFSLNSSDYVVAISNSVKTSLMNKLSIQDKKIKVIYNGVDLEKFSGYRKHDCEKIRVVFVGRLIEGKGVQLIIESIKNLKYNYSLDIIGDGEYREKLESLVAKYHLQERVTFWGTRTDIPEFLSNADVFVHVPLFEEGFGITIVEAMASGLTCVCSKSGGIIELIEHEVTGYLVEKNSVNELRETLKYIFINYKSDSLEKMRINAKEKSKQFSIKVFTNSLDDLIELLIKNA